MLIGRSCKGLPKTKRATGGVLMILGVIEPRVRIVRIGRRNIIVVMGEEQKKNGGRILSSLTHFGLAKLNLRAPHDQFKCICYTGFAITILKVCIYLTHCH